MNTTLANVINAPRTAAVPSDKDLFGFELAPASSAVTITPIMSKANPDRQLGRRITFDKQTLTAYDKYLKSDKSLSAAKRKELRNGFLHTDRIEQLRELGVLGLRAAYKADDHAPKGRVPDELVLRRGGSLKLVSVEAFLGKDKTETPTQRIARLERELREVKAAHAKAKAEAAAPEVETVTVETTPVEQASE